MYEIDIIKKINIKIHIKYKLYIAALISKLTKYGLEEDDMIAKINKTKFIIEKKDVIIKLTNDVNKEGYCNANPQVIDNTIKFVEYEIVVVEGNDSVQKLIHELLHLFAINEKVIKNAKREYIFIKGMQQINTKIINKEIVPLEDMSTLVKNMCIDEAMTELLRIELTKNITELKELKNRYTTMQRVLEMLTKLMYGDAVIENTTNIYFKNPQKLYKDAKNMLDLEEETVKELFKKIYAVTAYAGNGIGIYFMTIIYEVIPVIEKAIQNYMTKENLSQKEIYKRLGLNRKRNSDMMEVLLEQIIK